MDSRAKLMSLFVLSAAALAGCTIGSPSTRPLIQGSDSPYFIGKQLVAVETEYLDRYACLDGSLLWCQCSSLRMGTCYCRC